MSGLPLLNPPVHYDGSATPSTPPTPAAATRVVAIIKTHALNHRFDIERRIMDASFEIVKERQMEFDTETDPETLYELFGEDADSLAEGPVWVYVLERRRAVEVWNTLMGDWDPEIARRDAPHSLRALYGISHKQNGLMGSPDAQTAEIQIASLFASSPPFPTSDLPGELGSPSRYGSMRSVSSSVLSALRRTASDEGYAPSNGTNPSTVNGSPGHRNANGRSLFKARPIPSTHVNPSIQPRTTRAAALRAGVVPPTKSPRTAPTKEQLEKTFANVPGHKRRESIPVASTAPPTVVPRMTRAASLRLGQQPAPTPVRRRATTNPSEDTFEGIPGHKRRESIPVASSRPPVVAPRLNRSAALRTQKETAPPSSYMFRASAPSVGTGLARSNSQASLKPPRPSFPRPSSQSSIQPVVSVRTPTARPASIQLSRSSSHDTITNSTHGTNHISDKEEPAKPKPRLSSVHAPNIAPRTNRSALLRAAKLEAAAAGAKKPNPKAVFV